MKINNKKCISRVSIKNLRTAKTRCIVSIIAIALTTILFTSLFTILMTMVKGIEESNFRYAGSSAHGVFKKLTEEQYDILRKDKGIEEYGLRRILGITAGESFEKSHAEISYMDKNAAKWSFCTPEKGNIPKENTNQAAFDTKVFECLGIKPEVGKKITLDIDVSGTIVSEEFEVSGYWKFDESAPVSNVLIPESRLEEILSEHSVTITDNYTSRYNLVVMLESDYNIEKQFLDILERNGFINGIEGDNNVSIGVNWGYMNDTFTQNLDITSVVTIAALLIFIIFTGYLIIYNIFRISVANDIRHYGMLKTIGTTQKQIKKMVMIQALILSAVGIPVGLLIGWIIGGILCPVTISTLEIYNPTVSISPLIFILSALFSLITVILSCFKPAKTAARVSPVEAIRYTEQASGFGKRTGKKGVSLFGMAKARFSGNKGKSFLVTSSLALSILIFTITFIFAGSFNMEKFLSEINTDFVVAQNDYFNYDWNGENAISLEEHGFIAELDGVTDSFVTYGIPSEYSTETFFDKKKKRELLKEDGYDKAEIDDIISNDAESDGTYANHIQILGVEEYALSKIDVLEGDISKIMEEGYIAVNMNDEFRLGDKIKIRYTDKLEYVNTITGEIYEFNQFEDIPVNEIQNLDYIYKANEAEYEIAAVVNYDLSLGYGYTTGAGLFITSADDLISKSDYSAPLYIAFDTTEEAEPEIEKFISDYTKKTNLNYRSRATEAAAFESFRRMFIALGTVLGVIVGLIGILNFVNTMIMSIHTRQKEIAALQAIGMTGKQLRKMLIYEGLIYVSGAGAVSLLLNLISFPLGRFVEKVFWFCEFKYSFIPLAVTIPVLVAAGILIPIVTYRIYVKKSIVERLRTNE